MCDDMWLMKNLFIDYATCKKRLGTISEKKYHSALSSNEFSWNVQENYCNKSCLRVVNDADTILEFMSYSDILKLPGKTNIYGAERCLGFHKYQLIFSKVFISIRICQFSI